MLIFADTGADSQLKAWLNNQRPAAGGDLTLKLFTNDITPEDFHTAENYTEATGGGYAPKTLIMGNWTVAIVNFGTTEAPVLIALATYAKQTFTFTGPLTGGAKIIGYYLVDADGILQWAERLPDSAQLTPANDGDAQMITPKFKSSKGTPT